MPDRVCWSWCRLCISHHHTCRAPLVWRRGPTWWTTWAAISVKLEPPLERKTRQSKKRRMEMKSSPSHVCGCWCLYSLWLSCYRCVHWVWARDSCSYLPVLNWGGVSSTFIATRLHTVLYHYHRSTQWSVTCVVMERPLSVSYLMTPGNNNCFRNTIIYLIINFMWCLQIPNNQWS